MTQRHLRSGHLVLAACLLSMLWWPSTISGQAPMVQPHVLPPAEQCEFNGARVGAAVRRIAGKGPAPYYFACQIHNRNADDSGCVKGSLPPGLVVSVDRTQAGWSCITGGDSTSGWVEDSRLEELPHLPRPRLADWVGWWALGRPVGREDNVLLLTLGEAPGSIRVSGRAYWHGLPGVVHSGQVNGEAIPIGNHLHLVGLDGRGDPSGCVLDLTLTIQKGVSELQAGDNQRCGGMNVNFWGTWRRFVPVPAKRTAAQ